MDKTIEDVYQAAKNRICKEIDGVCGAAERRNLT